MEQKSTQMWPVWLFLFVMKGKRSFPFPLSPPLAGLKAESPWPLSVTWASPEQHQTERFSPIPHPLTSLRPTALLCFASCRHLKCSPVQLFHSWWPSSHLPPPITSRWRGLGEHQKVLHQCKTLPPSVPSAVWLSCVSSGTYKIKHLPSRCLHLQASKADCSKSLRTKTGL